MARMRQCPTPQQCGVRQHEAGSHADRECQSGRTLGDAVAKRASDSPVLASAKDSTERYREPDEVYATQEELSAAMERHFSASDMPKFLRCYPHGKGYGLETEVEGIPYGVLEPEGYRGDDGHYYWGANTSFSERLHQEGYVLKSMHSSEHPSPAFIQHQMGDRLEEGGAATVGCVVVGFGEEEPEWAWVMAED